MRRKVLIATLAAVFFTGLILRTIWLGKRPVGFTWDEAALGYTAYSLLKTGRDEYGKALPVVLKSFGDYKPGLYAYFAVPWVATVGLTELATRMPSAIAGSLLLVVVYLLAKEVVGRRAAWWSSLIMTFNPWSIHFSRGAWEANIALLLTTLGVVLFLKKKYFVSALFLGLTFWTYHGAKMFTPLLILVLIRTFRPAVRLLYRPAMVLLVLLIPIVVGIGSQSGRLKVFSVFSYRRSAETISQISRQDNVQSKNWLFYAFHSEIYDQFRGIVQRYTNHFSPYFLFVAGDWTNGRHLVPYYGYFHWPELALIVLGAYVLVKRGQPTQALIWWWLLLAPVPAALSRDLVSGVRSLPMFVPLTIIAGVGLATLADRKWLVGIWVLVMVFFVTYFADLYLVHSPFFTSVDWLAAYKPAWQIVKAQADNYQRVVFTDQLGQPYIFGLFYLQVDPAKYQTQARLIEDQQGDVGRVKSFERYEFRPIYWPADRGLTSTLFVGGEYELPESDVAQTGMAVKLGQINYPNNTVGLRVVGVK